MRAKGLNDLPYGTELLLYGKVYTVIGRTLDNKRYQVDLNGVIYNLKQSQLKHCKLFVGDLVQDENITA